MRLREMLSSECSMLIAEQRVARLGCCRDNQPYVVPIYYVRAEGQIFGFSMPGRKIEFMRSIPLISTDGSASSLKAGTTNSTKRRRRNTPGTY